MTRVDLDTTVISALVNDREDPGSGYRRRHTHRWWQYRAHDYLFCSAEVLRELSAPGFRCTAAALEIANDSDIS